MAYCEYPRDFMLFDVTPVENLFLMEHMPHAPGDYVRVYLYGLMLCRYPSEDVTAESFAKALGIKPEEVTEAFRYWERAGLVMRLSDRPPRYQYISAYRAMLSGDDPLDGAYQYRDFFQRLQQLIGADRLVTPQEQARAVDWIETLKLPEEIVLILVEWQVKKAKTAGKSLRYIFRDMDAVAQRWSSEGVLDAESAQEWCRRDSEAGKAARMVLKHMGQKRAPSLEELNLAEKWLNEMGLTNEEIEDACKIFKNATSPSFGYLDSALRARVSGEEVPYREEVQETIVALGAAGRPTEVLSGIYADLLKKGFDHQAILYAAGQCSKRDKHTFDDLCSRLETWLRGGITSREAAEEYARRREPGEKLMAQVYETLGLHKHPTRAEVSTAINWLSVFPEEVVFFAADIASKRDLDKRISYMTKILSEWQLKGVKDLESAKAEAAAFEKASTTSAGAARAPKRNPAQQYDQRKYDDEQMKHIAIDFTDLPGDEEA